MKKLLLSTIILIGSIAGFSQKRTAHITVEDQLNEEYCSGLFRTPEGIYFDMLNNNTALSANSYNNILDWLQGRVAGLQVYTLRNDERIPYIRNSRASIYVDELLTDPASLNSLPASDIAMIKIIKGPFAGFGAPGGVIAIYTIGTDDEEEEE